MEDKQSDGRRKSGRARNLPAETSVGGLSVTVSIGVAEPGPKMREVEQVIQAADKALYRAKKAGRNRVEISGESRSRAAKRSIA
jgi:diguanylate cyclase (GGDEF)-like protein